MTSRIPFSSDDSDDVSSLTGGKPLVDRISAMGADRSHLKVGTGAIEVVDSKVELKSGMTCAAQGITFSDSTVQTTKGEAPLTFANGINTVTGGSISCADGSDTVVLTPSAP